MKTVQLKAETLAQTTFGLFPISSCSLQIVLSVATSTVFASRQHIKLQQNNLNVKSSYEKRDWLLLKVIFLTDFSLFYPLK